MKGTVVEPITIDDTDRTADLTVEVSSDAGVLQSTKVILIPIDTFSEQLVIEKIRDLLNEEIVKAGAIPLTEQQVKDTVLGLQITVPGGP